jgi:hypothetical protein
MKKEPPDQKNTVPRGIMLIKIFQRTNKRYQIYLMKYTKLKILTRKAAPILREPVPEMPCVVAF